MGLGSPLQTDGIIDCPMLMKILSMCDSSWVRDKGHLSAQAQSHCSERAGRFPVTPEYTVDHSEVFVIKRSIKAEPDVAFAQLGPFCPRVRPGLKQPNKISTSRSMLAQRYRESVLALLVYICLNSTMGFSTG